MRERLWASLGSLIFLFVAPGTVAGLIPWWIAHGHIRPAFFDIEPLRWIGAILIVAGALVVLEAFARFALHGLGTPAPVYPTQRLVTNGLYRMVRNPIYWAVVAMIEGQALLLGDTRLAVYGLGVFAAFHLFVLGYEEPVLRHTYGAEYEQFCRDVPRWVPRLRG